MALRKRQIQVSDEWREKLSASGTATILMKRLRANALGELDPPLSANQIRSAEIVLAKIVPNLSSTDIHTEVTHRYAADVPMTKSTIDEWHQHNAPATVQ